MSIWKLKTNKIYRKIPVLLFLILVVLAIPIKSYAQLAPNMPYPGVTPPVNPVTPTSPAQDIVQQAQYNANVAYAAASLAAKRAESTPSPAVITAAQKAEADANTAQQGAVNAQDYANKQPPDLANAYSELQRTEVAVQGAKGANDQAASVAQAQDQAEKTKHSNDCFYTSYGIPNIQPVVCIKLVTSWIAYIFLYICAWLTGFAGLLFNTVLTYTVVDMRARIEGIPAIDIGWALFRDLGNLIFIFVLLYVAIKTILGLEDGSTKKLIRNVIIIALLVNFSLFFTKFLIDGSNILSISFFNLTTKAANSTASVGGVFGTVQKAQDYSTNFAKFLGIQGIFDPNAFAKNMAAGDGWGTIVITGIGGSLFLLMFAFTFLYASILFVIRFISLIILMIISPLAFIAWILPGTKQYWNMWWQALSGQLIFAPLYLLLMYLVFLYSSALGKTPGISGSIVLDPAIVGQPGGAEKALAGAFNFIVLIGFMTAAAVISTKFAAGSGGMIGNAVNAVNKKFNPAKIPRALGGAAVATAGASARGTVGRAAAAADEKFAKTALGNSRMGRFVRENTTEKVAKAKMGTSQSSFELRKKNKSANDKYAEEREKELTKNADKKADNREIGSDIYKSRENQAVTLDTQVREATREAEAHRINIETMEGQMDTTSGVTRADINAKKEAMEKKKKEAYESTTIPAERDRLLKEVKDEEKVINDLNERRAEATKAIDPALHEKRLIADQITRDHDKRVRDAEKARQDYEKFRELDREGKLVIAATDVERAAIKNKTFQANIDKIEGKRGIGKAWKNTKKYSNWALGRTPEFLSWAISGGGRRSDAREAERKRLSDRLKGKSKSAKELIKEAFKVDNIEIESEKKEGGTTT